jgi:hypothetical protein
VPGGGVTVKVGVANATGVLVGNKGASVTAGGTTAVLFPSAVVSDGAKGSLGTICVGVGVGRGAKLPQANAGTSHKSDRISSVGSGRFTVFSVLRFANAFNAVRLFVMPPV